MGEEMSNLEKVYLIDNQGNKIEIGIPTIEIEKVAEPIETITRTFIGSCSGSFRLSEKSKRNLGIYIKTTLENIKLIRIFNKTNKYRTKKKLLGRINRNIYKQIKCRY